MAPIPPCPSSYPALILASDFTPFYVGEYYACAAVSRKNTGRDGIRATLARLSTSCA